ncbi:uncharacterized protein LOC131633168 [Vicia villosa]|uniref:uncharacterized protein LOC131633168 n=1 Tax=Vicia villosa TaxID=3911 RepID=UPI00273B4F8C|nr:uncharacterized protein LOC131633168 [Vicia villosa]
MKSAVACGKFSGFKFNAGEECFSHLQYADDTLIIETNGWGNIRIIKENLMLFEVISGLKVNFHKSLLVGINIEHDWIKEVAVILNCKVGSTPFKYLDLPIGANPGRNSTWQPVVEIVRARLASWKHKKLSIGVPVIIINSVLSAILVYFLSFFKAPTGTLCKLESLFKHFLWGGSEDERKINWEKWEKMCRPIEEGGLGIKKLKAFNDALLGKWIWKTNTEKESLWYRALVNRYEACEGIIRREDNNSLIWWRDIKMLNAGIGEGVNSFSVKEAYKKIISGSMAPDEPFLAKVWKKSIPIKVSYFVWKALQNRVATKENLYSTCGLISRWLGIYVVFQNEGLPHLLHFEGLMGVGRSIVSRLNNMDRNDVEHFEGEK